MVAYNRDADSVGDFPKKEEIREASQVDPPTALRLEMKMSRVGDGPLYE